MGHGTRWRRVSMSTHCPAGSCLVYEKGAGTPKKEEVEGISKVLFSLRIFWGFLRSCLVYEFFGVLLL